MRLSGGCLVFSFNNNIFDHSSIHCLMETSYSLNIYNIFYVFFRKFFDTYVDIQYIHIQIGQFDGNLLERSALVQKYLRCFPSLCVTRTEADPVILAKYVVALLKKDKPLQELQNLCTDNLVEFLGNGMQYFKVFFLVVCFRQKFIGT